MSTHVLGKGVLESTRVKNGSHIMSGSTLYTQLLVLMLVSRCILRNHANILTRPQVVTLSAGPLAIWLCITSSRGIVANLSNPKRDLWDRI